MAWLRDLNQTQIARAGRPHAHRRDAGATQAAQSIAHYQIGPVAVTFASNVAVAAEEWHDRYQRYDIDRPPRERFLIEIVQRRSRRSLRNYYHVLANGEQLFIIRRTDEILPHAEWALNNHVARFLPGYLSIHASVVARNGVGLICPGDPGAGKTTLAAGLLLRGWSYLSDEFALIDLVTGDLTAYPKALCIKAGSFDVLREAGVPTGQVRVHHKGYKGRVIMLDPTMIRPDIVCPACRLGMIVFPQYSPEGPPSIEPMSRAEAVFELTKVAFNFAKYRRRGFEVLTKAVQNASCYRLRVNDLSATAELIESHLPRIAESRRKTG